MKVSIFNWQRSQLGAPWWDYYEIGTENVPLGDIPPQPVSCPTARVHILEALPTLSRLGGWRYVGHGEHPEGSIRTWTL